MYLVLSRLNLKVEVLKSAARTCSYRLRLLNLERRDLRQLVPRCAIANPAEIWSSPKAKSGPCTSSDAGGSTSDLLVTPNRKACRKMKSLGQSSSAMKKLLHHKSCLSTSRDLNLVRCIVPSARSDATGLRNFRPRPPAPARCPAYRDWGGAGAPTPQVPSLSTTREVRRCDWGAWTKSRGDRHLSGGGVTRRRGSTGCGLP